MKSNEMTLKMIECLMNFKNAERLNLYLKRHLEFLIPPISTQDFGQILIFHFFSAST